MRLFAVLGFVVLAWSSACGARTGFGDPHGDGGIGGESGLTCPTYACDESSVCRACVDSHLGECAGVASCDVADGVCQGNLPEVQACRVFAAQTVDCMLACPFQECEDAYFAADHGTMPVGLAFNDYICAVCDRCEDECSGTPNFSLVCSL